MEPTHRASGDRLAEALQAEEQAKTEAQLWKRLFLQHATAAESLAVQSLPVLRTAHEGARTVVCQDDELKWLRQGLLFSNHQAIESGGVGVAAAAAVAAASVHKWLTSHGPLDASADAGRRHAETEPDVVAPCIIDPDDVEDALGAALPEQLAFQHYRGASAPAAPSSLGMHRVSSLPPLAPSTPSRAGFEVRCLLPQPPERRLSNKALSSTPVSDAPTAAASGGRPASSSPCPDGSFLRVTSARGASGATAAGAQLQRDFFSRGPSGAPPPSPARAASALASVSGGLSQPSSDCSLALSSDVAAAAAARGAGGPAAAGAASSAEYLSISHYGSRSSVPSSGPSSVSDSSDDGRPMTSAVASPASGSESLATAEETLSVLSFAASAVAAAAAAESEEEAPPARQGSLAAVATAKPQPQQRSTLLDITLGGVGLATTASATAAAAAAAAAAARWPGDRSVVAPCESMLPCSGAAAAERQENPPHKSSCGGAAAGGTDAGASGWAAAVEGQHGEPPPTEPRRRTSTDDAPRSPIISPRAPPRLRTGAAAGSSSLRAPPTQHPPPSWEAKTDVTRCASAGSLALLLRWHDRPSSVLVVAKRCGGPLVEQALREAVGLLAQRHECTVFVEPQVFRMLAGSAEASDRQLADMVSTWGDVGALRAQAADDRRQREAASSSAPDPCGCGIPNPALSAVGPLSAPHQSADGDARPVLPPSVAASLDIAVTLGGDGTILWLSQLLGSGPVPPIVSFSLGSLCFMTPFAVSELRPTLDLAVEGGFHITLRHRLICSVVRSPTSPLASPSTSLTSSSSASSSSSSSPVEEHVVLNDVVIDRGLSAALTHLECFCDDGFVTTVQGDGLIVATPSGSTAYSMSAGGSMVHPQVPAILFTPICPHSLSFRPLVFPDFVLLRIQVPSKARGTMSASFDGRDRIVLHPGDAVLVRMSRWPLPMVCHRDPTTDWFTSIREVLHWNERTIQKPR